MVSKSVHSHGDCEVLQIVQELTEDSKLFKGDSIVFFDTIQKTIQEHIIPVSIESVKLKFLAVYCWYWNFWNDLI